MGAQAILAQAYPHMATHERPEILVVGELAVLKSPLKGTIIPCRLYSFNKNDDTYNTDLGDRIHRSHLKPMPEELRAQQAGCICLGVDQAAERDMQHIPTPRHYHDPTENTEFKSKFEEAEELKAQEYTQMFKKLEAQKLALARELEQAKKQHEDNLEEQQQKLHEAQQLAEQERNRAEEERTQKEKAQADADYAQKEAERYAAEAERQRQADAEAKAKEKEREKSEKEKAMQHAPKSCCIVL
eukprot:NODE_18429_length_893_cov_5.896867.p1 GENE.NODE_18429_length_893_cov_5.896867~~NODE_18429_length_893_cov_5.896867.p1  ORF type:complete len:243 (-),score=69.91 NODE_18429_length_893_cov_5.896867:164-892(-)